MSAKTPRSKVGLVDYEFNFYTKLLFCFMFLLAFILTALRGFDSIWYINFTRYMLLMAFIIPISLRVNLDFAKIYYSLVINSDKLIEGTIARNS